VDQPTWADVPVNIRLAINRYVRAKVAESWKGGRPPEEFREIEEEVSTSKQAMAAMIVRYAGRQP
jgi:hypothetical protein